MDEFVLGGILGLLFGAMITFFAAAAALDSRDAVAQDYCTVQCAPMVGRWVEGCECATAEGWTPVPPVVQR